MSPHPTIVLDYPPKPQIRARIAKGGRRVYDPSKKDKEDLAMLILAQRPVMIVGGVYMMITFHMKRPKSHYKSKKAGGGVVDITYHTNKPDIDNLIKFVMDACNGILWKDDKQVCVLSTEKVYTTGWPRIEIAYKEID